jgi:hypothetical protein
MKYASVGFTSAELKFIQEVLDDERAWNVRFTLVDKNPDFTILKVPGKDIDAHYATKPFLHGLSVCDRIENRIYFRKENWIPFRSLPDTRCENCTARTSFCTNSDTF